MEPRPLMLVLAAALGVVSVLAGALAARRGVDLRSAEVRANDIPLVLFLTALLSFCAAAYPELVPAGVWWTVLLTYELVAGVVVGHGATSALSSLITAADDRGDDRRALLRPRPHVPFMYYVALCLLVPFWPLLVPVIPISL